MASLNSGQRRAGSIGRYSGVLRKPDAGVVATARHGADVRVMEPSQIGTPDQTEPNTKSVVRVYMSHAHAKTMLPLLAKLLAEYEGLFGTIPAPGFEEMGKA